MLSLIYITDPFPFSSKFLGLIDWKGIRKGKGKNKGFLGSIDKTTFRQQVMLVLFVYLLLAKEAWSLL